MSKKSNISFEWNGSHKLVIHNLGFGIDLQEDAAWSIYQHSYEYMPYLTGPLSNQVQIDATDTSATITHDASAPGAKKSYAQHQYHLVDESRRCRVHHPLATSEWYKYGLMANSQQIIDDIERSRLKYRTFHYG